MQDNMSIELAQEWDGPNSFASYLRQLASKVEGNPLLADKQLYLHVEGTGDNKTIYLETL